MLRKKELKEEYWPRLLKDKAKVHYLRTDFDKVSRMHFPASFTQQIPLANFPQWVDEDEQNEAPEDDYMNQFGGGLGEDGGFGGIDFSKLGGGEGGLPGMEGLGGAGAGPAGEEDDDEDEDEDEDDDDMPDLEDDDKEAAAPAGKGKAKA